MKTLKMEVMEMLENMVEEDYSLEQIISDVLEHGCVSGMISELIYCYQTEEFFDNHKDEINKLAHELSEDIYGNPFDLYKNLRYECSKNTLSWFAFEEVTRRIADEMEIEY